jgi:uncharacterized protein (TIGR01777 family)
MRPVSNYCPDQKKFTRSKTRFPLPGYCIHQEDCDITPVDTPSLSPRVLLSGASGMLGTALRETLASRNFSVLQLLRCTPVAPNQLQWNSASTPTIPHSESLEGLSAAIHLSGANLAAHRWTPKYKREIAESRIGSTRTLATTLASLRNPPQMLLVASATGIYGNRGDELIDETSPVGSGFLADLCQEWEAAAQPAAEAGIRVLHLRFGVILGPGPGGALARLLPIFRFGLGGRLGSGRQFMSWISLTDALEAILFLLQSSALAGPFDFTAPNPITNAQFTSALARWLHRPAFLSVPAFALRLALGEMANETVLSGVRAYPAKLAAAGYQFTHPSLVHALPSLLAPRQP